MKERRKGKINKSSVWLEKKSKSNYFLLPRAYCFVFYKWIFQVFIVFLGPKIFYLRESFVMEENLFSQGIFCEKISNKLSLREMESVENERILRSVPYFSNSKEIFQTSLLESYLMQFYTKKSTQNLVDFWSYRKIDHEIKIVTISCCIFLVVLVMETLEKISQKRNINL